MPVVPFFVILSNRMPNRWIAVAALALAPAAALGQTPHAALADKLATPVRVTWDNAPLARALDSLGRAQQVTIVRDRRLDPARPLRLAVNSVPLGEALAQIATELKVGYCQLGPVAYLGPAASAARLRTLAAVRRDDAQRLNKALSRKLLALRSWQWDELAEPRELAARLAAEAGLELSGRERIPHDLWPAVDLPPMSWIDRMTLIVGQFDLTFRFVDGGKRVELAPIPARVTLARRYPGGADSQALAKRLQKELPDVKISIDGQDVLLVGRLEDHEAAERQLGGTRQRRTTVTKGEEAYTLAIERAALDRVVDELSKRLNLEFEWDRAAIDAARIATDQLVSVKVTDGSLDELLAQVFQGTGLTALREGRVVKIRVRKARD